MKNQTVFSAHDKAEAAHVLESISLSYQVAASVHPFGDHAKQELTYQAEKLDRSVVLLREANKKEEEAETARKATEKNKESDSRTAVSAADSENSCSTESSPKGCVTASHGAEPSA